MSPLAQNIIKTLLYYDIFDYPLTAQEIFHTTNQKAITLEEVETALKHLCKEGYIWTYQQFFSLRETDEIVERRKKGNQVADAYLPRAYRLGRFIARFPFVRGVYISGSLSKHYIEEDDDIDYFIITEPNRLWLTRTLLILFKKVFLLNSSKYFCLNYFLDTEHTAIQEKSLFTATEVVTLLPIYNLESYENFLSINNWTKDYCPNFPKRDTMPILNKDGFVKRLGEFLLNNKLGDWLDTFLMKQTIQYLKRKHHYLDQVHFEMAFKAKKHVSTYHPRIYQQKVANAYYEKMTTFEKKYAIKLANV